MNRRGPAVALGAAAVLLLVGAVAAVAPLRAGEIYVQAQNDLQASHDTEREVDIVEDWLDLDLYGDGFQLGIRYSSFAPPDPIVSTDLKSSEGITHRFAELQLENTRLRVGTFTRLMGRGLIFRSFENRDLRVDTNLDGLLIEQEGGWWRGALLSGRTETGQMETGERRRADRFSGADMEVDLGRMIVGGSFLAMERPNSPARPQLQALRASLVDGPFTLDWEGARHLPDNPQNDDARGAGQVVETSYLVGPLGLYAGYKHYNGMSVLTQDQKLMNQPPVLIHDPRATLMNRHPHQLDPNDEKGFLADVSLSTPAGEWLVSYAETQNLDAKLGANSFTESFLEWDRYGLGPFESGHLILDFQQTPYFDTTDLAEPEWVWDYFVTTALDLRLPVYQGTLVGIWEHQHKQADHVGDYDDELFVLEYEHANGWSLSVLGEFLNWTDEQQVIEGQLDPRSRWSGLQVAGPIGDRHTLRVFAGGRRAGYICVGGVCRYEPAFDGIELTLISRF
ncbi:MAG: hypothetical protein H6694_05710 [Candidatus Latescibacteria bacterium]|nr:hypothetical protein [Candidatus Latescibacterota bacterium]